MRPTHLVFTGPGEKDERTKTHKKRRIPGVKSANVAKYAVKVCRKDRQKGDKVLTPFRNP